MIKIKRILIALLALMFAVAYPTITANAVTCFKSYEYVSGFNKICVYNCLGSDRAITIQSTQLCPLTING